MPAYTKAREYELELELVQSQMAQKPMGARALRVRSVPRGGGYGRAWMLTVIWSRLGGRSCLSLRAPRATTILYASNSKCASANLTREAPRTSTRGSLMMMGFLFPVVPFTTDLAGSPRARVQAERLAWARGRAALWALNDADRPGWRPGAAIGCPRAVLVHVAASSGGGTAVGL